MAGDIEKAGVAVSPSVLPYILVGIILAFSILCICVMLFVYV